MNIVPQSNTNVLFTIPTGIPLFGGFAVTSSELLILAGCGVVGYLVSKSATGFLVGIGIPIAAYTAFGLSAPVGF